MDEFFSRRMSFGVGDGIRCGMEKERYATLLL